MLTRIVLAVHGSPPLDFPAAECAEFFGLHTRMEHHGGNDPGLVERYRMLDDKMRRWPRTADNDPFFAASQEIARQLDQDLGLTVLVGYNEFCWPTLEIALEEAAHSADRVVVITPMLTRGGEHAERDIPAAIEQARQRYPDVDFRYAWPFPLEEIAGFLAKQVERHVD